MNGSIIGMRYVLKMNNTKSWRRSHKGIPTQASITEKAGDFVVSMLGSPITAKAYEGLEEAKRGADSKIAELHPSHSCEESVCSGWREIVGGIE